MFVFRASLWLLAERLASGTEPCMEGGCASRQGEEEDEQLAMLQVARGRATHQGQAASQGDAKREQQYAMLKVLTNYDPEHVGWNKNFSFQRYEAQNKAILCEGAFLHHNLVGDWGPRRVFIEYGAVADFSINGHYQILGAEIQNDTLAWDGDVVRYNVRFHSGYVILGSLREFHTITEMAVTFGETTATDPGCVLMDNVTDGEPMRSFSQLGAPENPKSTCVQIKDNCGAKYNPFADSEECETFYSHLPWQCASGFGKGNSWVCRSLHVFTSKVAPEFHCNHTTAKSSPPGPHGPGSGFCRDEDCEDSRYCLDMFCVIRGRCVQDPATYLMTCDWEYSSWWQNVPSALTMIGNVLKQIIR